MKMCNLATIRFGKALIDDVKSALDKIKIKEDSMIKVFFDGGCSGLNSTVIKYIFNFFVILNKNFCNLKYN